MKALTYIEVDVPTCSRTYGVAPCTASIPTTGAIKCFNSLGTCQDRVNFGEVTTTLRFAMDTAYLPKSIDCIPSLTSVSFTPAIVSLGEDLGQRASISVTFKDHRWNDVGAGYDPYLADRAYDPFAQGTYWGKFRSRHPFLRGRKLRLIRGYVGQTLAEMTTHHFIVESTNGPSMDGTYTIIAKDILKLADGDRAQAPRLSNGRLLANITNVATSATLTPTGIGNAEYPASGYVAIGGKEICSFTRSGDVLTLTRAQYNTTAIAHNAESMVQLCLRYNALNPANIIYDLLINYGSVPSTYISYGTWSAEVDTYLQRVYTGLVAQPTAVATLVSELIEQAALALWWDDIAQTIRLQVLKPISTNADTFTPERVLISSTSVQEQPNKRVSEVWVYYAQINPLKAITDEDNFRSVRATVDLQAETDYGSAAIKKIFSRWIPEFGSSVATRLGDIQLGRYRDPPRLIQFELHRDENVVLGTGYQVQAWCLQDETGAAENVPVQVTRLDPQPEKYKIEAEESLFTSFVSDDPNNRVIIIDANTYNFNLRTVHDTLYPVITDPTGITLTCIVAEGAIVGSTSTANPAFNVGSWVAGLDITIQVLGRIQGCGGKGGNQGYDYPAPGATQTAGGAGGTAFYTRYAITMDDTAGELWGGGGGGGGARAAYSGAGGGGGAGLNWGAIGVQTIDAYHTPPTAGTTSAGGQGGKYGIDQIGGNGGGPGLVGEAGDFGYSPYTPNNHLGAAGGAAGKYIDGTSYVTNAGTPLDRRGTSSA